MIDDRSNVLMKIDHWPEDDNARGFRLSKTDALTTAISTRLLLRNDRLPSSTPRQRPGPGQIIRFAKRHGRATSENLSEPKIVYYTQSSETTELLLHSQTCLFDYKAIYSNK
jgi:hypothetical protein